MYNPAGFYKNRERAVPWGDEYYTIIPDIRWSIYKPAISKIQWKKDPPGWRGTKHGGAVRIRDSIRIMATIMGYIEKRIMDGDICKFHNSKAYMYVRPIPPKSIKYFKSAASLYKDHVIPVQIILTRDDNTHKYLVMRQAVAKSHELANKVNAGKKYPQPIPVERTWAKWDFEDEKKAIWAKYTNKTKKEEKCRTLEWGIL